jgi:beta-lactamase superfamily II metal-dependent hydrolase
MDVFTLYAGQGSLAAARSGNEAVIIDAHMPDCDTVTPKQIEESLDAYLSNSHVRGLILTGLDKDHACPTGVESILTKYEPDWVMYPTCYKDTETATKVFEVIARHVKRRANTQRPLRRESVRVDNVDSRNLSGLANNFSFELFSPHMGDMDSSNNSSLVIKLTGLDPKGFRYLITGDTEEDRWVGINESFGPYLAADVMAAPHHGSRTGVNAQTLLLVSPHTVLISAGVDSCYGHPDSVAVQVYQRVAEQVFATNADTHGTCFLTRKIKDGFETHATMHVQELAANA